MDLTAAIACAAFLMGQSGLDNDVVVVVDTVVVRATRADVFQAQCEAAGRTDCAAVEFGVPDSVPPVLLVRLAPDGEMDWSEMVHTGCHAVQLGHGFTHRGPGAERQCEWVGARAERCH